MRCSGLFVAVLAAFAIGSAPRATAEPKQEESTERISYNEDEPEDGNDREPAARPDWVELASPTPAKHGTEYVLVGKAAGTFSQLRLDAAKGRTVVYRVRVYFEDGTAKVVRLDTTLGPHRKSAKIALGGDKLIERVVVQTDRKTDGEYALYGFTGGGAVASR